MKISLNWLKQFVEIPKEITPEKLAELLILKVVEVEGIEKQGENLEGVVAGKILSVEKHPDADKLAVCKVDIREEELKQIVCGGINLKEGMFVAVAKIGAKVKWRGEGELVEIKKTKIRGIESDGMICASSEIGLSDVIKCEEGEIIDLNAFLETKKQRNKETGETKENRETRNLKLEIGKLLSDLLDFNDTIFEIDNKSLTNRPDLWSHTGIAREIAAILNINKPINQLTNKPINSFNNSEDVKLSVKVESPELCKRYMAVSMTNIKIAPSPEWMQKRLLAVGMRPINNVVDVTNYVMLETGQPMHAFNQLRITNYELRITNAKEGEVIETIDNVERKLDEEMLVIADSEKAVAIAGIMGGANSEVDDNTTEIIIESANFEKVNNRKTAAKLGLRTEAAMRYEKGLDPSLTEQALTRCVELIQKIIPDSQISSEIIDVKAGLAPARSIEISTDYINKKIGVEIPKEKIISILESLGFNVLETQNIETQDLVSLQIEIPSWRATGDISISEDIIEEIARIYGYDNIEPKMPKIELAPVEEDKELNLIKEIKNILSIGFGMSEAQNYSFVSQKQLDDLGIDSKGCVKLANPLSEELALLRPLLAPNLIKNAKDNLRFYDNFRMFEIGSIFKNAEGGDCADADCGTKLPWQEKFVGGIVVGDKNSVPFFEAKNAVEELCRKLGVEFNILEKADKTWMHLCRSIRIRNQESGIRRMEIGYLTELSPIVAKRLGIKNARVVVFELSIKALIELAKDEKKYQKISPFPAALRDIAVVVEKEILVYNIINAVKEAGGEILRNIDFFDYYEGDKIGFGKKSLAFHLTFQAEDKTLEDKEVDELVGKIIEAIEGLGGKLRD